MQSSENADGCAHSWLLVGTTCCLLLVLLPRPLHGRDRQYPVRTLEDSREPGENGQRPTTADVDYL